MIKSRKIALALCIVMIMLMASLSFVFAANGNPTYMKSEGGTMDDAVSISNFVKMDNKKYMDYKYAYICNSPAVIKTDWPLNFFEVIEISNVNGKWIDVGDYLQPYGGMILKFWDNDSGKEIEITLGPSDVASFDIEAYEKAHPNRVLLKGLSAAGSQITLSKKGVYRVGISGPGSMPDNVNAIIIVNDNSSVTSKVQAIPTASEVLVNNKAADFDAYNIDGNNYFKLRDIAYVLNDTKKQFEVKWNQTNNAIELISGLSYTTSGGEMQSKGEGSKSATATGAKILKDNKEIDLTAYNIGGNNYFKLRDIGKVFDFGVGWDSEKNRILINTDIKYTE